MVAPVCFGIVGCILAWGLAPGLTSFDAGELMAASHELGIAHPPGFPLFAIVHKGISFLIPVERSRFAVI